MQIDSNNTKISDPGDAQGLSRRDWIQRLILSGGAALLFGAGVHHCRHRMVNSVSSDRASFDPPFGTWRALQQVIRRSPDHLLARADEVVRGGNPRAVLAFVAESFQVIPGGESRWFDPAHSVRWGVTASLRSGSGTLRELAELAVALLGRVGVAARVKMVDARQVPADRLAALLALRPEIKFGLPWSAQERSDLRRQALGPRRPAPFLTTEHWHREGRDLANGVLRLLGDEATIQGRGFSPDLAALPVVEVDFAEGREIVFASMPGAPSIPAGQIMVMNAGVASAPWQVRVRLLAAHDRAPGRFEELVAKTWSAPELIGRQLMIRCLPNLTWEEAAVVTFAGVRTFTPLLTVHGPGLAQEEAIALSAAGDAITLAGEKISLDGAGRVTVDGGGVVDEDEADAGRALSVTDMAVDIDARAYPEIVVHVTPRDGSGEVVAGLSARNFAMLEQGRPAPFLLAANQPAPRLALLVDQSASMPEAYRGPGAVRLLEELSTVAQRRYPAARLQLYTTDSDIWKWLDQAQGERPELVIYITDGDQDGPVGEDVLRRLRQSGPTLFIDAGREDPAVFAPFLEVTGGTRVAVTSAAEAVEAMAQHLAALPVAPYRFSLAATSMEPEQRTLGLRVVAGGGPTGMYVETAYRVPAMGERVLPLGLCTLAVEVELSRPHESTIVVRRILAGYDPESDNKPTPEDKLAVRDAMFACHLLQVEGGGTTAALRLDEQLESQLSTEALIKAVQNGEDPRAHLTGCPIVIPSEALALTGRIGDPDRAGVVYEHGMRMVLFGLVPRLGTNLVRRRVDVLPTAVFRSALEDPGLGFRSTARATALLAVLESHLFPDSTHAALKGRDLILDPSHPSQLGLTYGASWNTVRAMVRSSGVRHAPQYFLIPGGGGSVSWMVNRNSGELYGMLNGAGGAEIMESIKRQTQEFESVITVYAMIMDKMASSAGVPAAGAFALAVVAEYSKTLVKLYAAVSYVLINMRSEDLDEAIRQILTEFAENVIKEIFPVIFDDEKMAEDINAIIAVCYMVKP
jgi:hypothetical protein